MFLFSAVPAKAFQDVSRFPELAPLSEQWTTLREEALRLFDEGHIRGALANNDVGFNSFFKRGWKRFYVKWYGDPLRFGAGAVSEDGGAARDDSRRSRRRCSRSSSPART